MKTCVSPGKTSPQRKYDANSFANAEYMSLGRIVSDETREKVRAESTKIAEDSKRFIEATKRRMQREAHIRCRRIELNRLHQVSEWRVKTANSPFRPDLYKTEMHRERLQTSQNKRIKQENDRQELVASLTGDINVYHDVCPPRRIDALSSIDDRHSMQFRHANLRKNKVTHERDILTRLVNEEIDSIAQKLSALNRTV